jgi:hypothetical protein
MGSHVMARMPGARVGVGLSGVRVHSPRQAVPAYQTAVEPKLSPATKHSSAYEAILQEARPQRNTEPQ